MLPQGDCHPPEMAASGPVLVHVASNEHAEVMGGRHAAPGRGKSLRAASDPLGAPGAAQAHAGAQVGGAETDHVVGVTGGDGGGGVADGGVACAPAVGDGFPVAQVLDAQRLGEQGLVVGLHVIADQAVDVLRGDASVIAGGPDGFGGELQLTATGVPGELGLADADDGGLVPDAVGFGGDGGLHHWLLLLLPVHDLPFL